MPPTTDLPVMTYRPFKKLMDKFGSEKLMQMDPKLQQAIILRRSGARELLTVAVAEDEIAVLTKVTSFSEWQQCTDVRGAIFIVKSIDGIHDIASGRIPISRIENIRTLPFVKSLKAARKLKPALSKTATAVQLPELAATGISSWGGKGVVIGIVDSGCDFVHQNFQVNGKTRIRKLWDQRFPAVLPDGNDGKIYTSDDINKALQKADPYKALGYSVGGAAAHGTHVMDIAAGNGKGSGTPGIAPDADICFVHVSAHDIAWQGKEVLNQSFGDSVNLVEAIRFIFLEAGDQPCVINISLGTNGGPHDGSTLVEESIDSLLSEKPNRCVVIAASNSHEDGIHTKGNLAPGASVDIPWMVQGNDATENELDLWYPRAGRLSIEIINPAGTSLGVVDPGESGSVNDSSGIVQVVVSNRLDDSGNRDNNVGVWMKENQGGGWLIRLKNVGSIATSFHAWIERDDNGQSSFGGANDPGYTLGSISCSNKAVTVGSFDATVSGSPISPFSSAGPTRDGREKPEISAPGSKVVAARSGTINGTVAKSGTSMASPAVTGCIAILYAEAFRQKKPIDIDTLRKLIQNSGQLNPPATIWDARFGSGRISVAKLLGQLGVPAPGPANTAAKKSAVGPARKKAAKKAVGKKAAKKSAKKNSKKAGRR